MITDRRQSEVLIGDKKNIPLIVYKIAMQKYVM